MHHKRGRSKDRRAGCLMCKFNKSNSYKDSWNAQTMQERKARIAEREQLREIVDK
jgi:hypothetical protein